MSTKILNLLINNIEIILAEKRILKIHLAKKMGISKQLLYGYLKGQHAPGIDKVEAIAEALEVPIFVLFMDADERAHWKVMRNIVDHALKEEFGKRKKD